MASKKLTTTRRRGSMMRSAFWQRLGSQLTTWRWVLGLITALALILSLRDVARIELLPLSVRLIIVGLFGGVFMSVAYYVGLSVAKVKFSDLGMAKHEQGGVKSPSDLLANAISILILILIEIGIAILLIGTFFTYYPLPLAFSATGAMIVSFWAMTYPKVKETKPAPTTVKPWPPTTQEPTDAWR